MTRTDKTAIIMLRHGVSEASIRDAVEDLGLAGSAADRAAQAIQALLDTQMPLYLQTTLPNQHWQASPGISMDAAHYLSTLRNLGIQAHLGEIPPLVAQEQSWAASESRKADSWTPPAESRESEKPPSGRSK